MIAQQTSHRIHVNNHPSYLRFSLRKSYLPFGTHHKDLHILLFAYRKSVTLSSIVSLLPLQKQYSFVSVFIQSHVNIAGTSINYIYCVLQCFFIAICSLAFLEYLQNSPHSCHRIPSLFVDALAPFSFES